MKYLVASIVLVAAASSFALPTPAAQAGLQFAVGNIPTVLTSNGLTTLVNSVVKAGLAEALSGPGPFTVFAPTNNAFANVDPATLNTILGDINLLKKVLSYHVVTSSIPSTAVQNELTPRTLAGESLRINVYGSGGDTTVTVNGALRIRTLEASNGVIHVINQVLVPEPESDIVSVLERKGSFSTLLTALNVAGLTSTVKNAGPFTLFAPTDEAFRALPAGALDSLIANPEKLKNVLLTHVVSGTIYSRGLPSGAVPVVAGGSIDAVFARGGVTVNNAKVIQTDLFASNGVIHIIDQVILRSTEPVTQLAFGKKSIVKTLASKGKFNTFITALNVAGLANHLDTDGPFTIFAPTDDAFQTLPTGVLDSLVNNPSELRKVLLSHVIPGALPSNKISSGTLNLARGGRVRVIADQGNVKIADADVIEADLSASNGVIHVINHLI